ncbi:MAG: hypothetical protein A3F92_02465 [Candidatus Rokubacteria bacterium RIFCSPLOWO2_12_FULL_71_22]|nr:MAG: hypothetical protein A3F92_02465 [Candidatus Rokubacteria bacterium RIFCSPLOWO2_12_FULL_71_22]
MPGPDLGSEWADLLSRRPEFRATLAAYGDLIDRWTGWEPTRSLGRAWTADECTGRWQRGVPLLVEAPPAIPAADVEDLLAAAMGHLASVDADLGPGLHRLAEAWDRGSIGAPSFFPGPGGVGSPDLGGAIGLPSGAVEFLACASLRPALEAYFTPCRAHLDDFVWNLGVCPFCGAPPGFSDVSEDGRRRLACHLCGGGWLFSRTRCPFCGTERTEDLVRLEPEARDQGHLVIGCGGCGLYLKELDRRVRWNGQSALVEDWGSPHFDLVARRAGYRRPFPPLTELGVGG